MRKILLATTALVGFVAAGAAQAATAPLNVTVGGDVDFIAGASHESKAASVAYDASKKRANYDFETLYSLNFGVTGKAANGIEYGGNLTLSNYPSASNAFQGEANGIEVSNAEIFMSGAYGKLVMGDARGATDLTFMAPTVGVGGVTGRFIDFVSGDTDADADGGSFAKDFAVGVDGLDHSTSFTYYTPKVGNDMHKVQAGVTLVPTVANYGSSVKLYNNNGYTNMIKGAAAYTGNFKPVSVGVSAHIITAGTDALHSVNRPFTSWGVEAQAALQGFTVGATYTDRGHYATVAGQNKTNEMYTAGIKYEFSKYAVGFSYLGGQGYSNFFDDATTTRVKDINAYNLGAAYTWAPGLTSDIDGVLFSQKSGVNVGNEGFVLLVSQKLAF